MKLFIEQEISINGGYKFSDENGDIKFSAYRKMLYPGTRIFVYDNYAKKVAEIKKKIFSLLACCIINIGNNKYTLVKKSAFVKPEYELKELKWIAKTNFFEQDFEIKFGSEVIMTIAKQSVTGTTTLWGDYIIDIDNPGHEMLALCITIAINCMRED
jgi:uncharacterized protein YxjI